MDEFSGCMFFNELHKSLSIQKKKKGNSWLTKNVLIVLQSIDATIKVNMFQ